MKEENGPLIALIVCVILSALFGVMAWLNYQELMGDDPNGSKSQDAKIKVLKNDVEKLEADIAEYQSKASGLREQIRRAQTAYNLHSQEYTDYGSEYQRRMKLVEWATAFDTQASELSGMVSKLKNDTLTKVNKETTDVREKMEKDLQQKNTDKEAAVTRTRQVKEEFDVDTKKYRSQKNYEQSGLDESKSVLTDLTQREPERADVLNHVDGHVILADPVHNLVVIDIGTTQGVRNGYRFECFTMRDGKNRITKGYLEVRHADPGKSECLIVQRPVALPRDPLSAYTAKVPEEMFSPYQESGRKGFTAQPLSAPPKVVMMGMNKEEPIVEGDFIENPFFSPTKSLTFYIAGAKEIANGVQRSAIRYTWPEIKSVIEFYRGTVSPAADVNVDYVITQKNPKTEGTDAEKAEYQKAVDLGLPIIYEWELFRFLDRK